MIQWLQQASLTYVAMHLFHISQCTILNRNMHIYVLNGALWDMGQVNCLRIWSIISAIPFLCLYHTRYQVRRDLAANTKHHVLLFRRTDLWGPLCDLWSSWGSRRRVPDEPASSWLCLQGHRAWGQGAPSCCLSRINARLFSLTSPQQTYLLSRKMF